MERAEGPDHSFLELVEELREKVGNAQQAYEAAADKIVYIRENQHLRNNAELVIQ